jgi:hypothetical protein
MQRAKSENTHTFGAESDLSETFHRLFTDKIQYRMNAWNRTLYIRNICIFIFFVSTLHLHSFALASSSFSIPFHTWGPQPINSTSVQLVNTTVYNGTLPPVNYSLPVLRLAGVITQTGAYTTNTPLISQVYPFMIDMINMKGGVVYNNQSYLLSLTWATDDSSPNYLQLLYSTWLNDPTIALFLAPATDLQYQILLPLIQATNRTFMNLIDSDPTNFLSNYPYTFTAIQPKSRTALLSMNSINRAAQLYTQQVQAGNIKPVQGSTISTYGITSVCMFTHNDSSQIQTCTGIRQWINSTNSARAAAGAALSDMISIVTDVFWPLASTSTDQSLYTSTFYQCPDNVDLLITCAETTTIDQGAISAALQTVQLRPKAAYSTSQLPGFSAGNATMANQWTGWISYGSPPLNHATLPNPTFSSSLSVISCWHAYFGSTASLTNQQVLFPSAFDMIKAALYLTPSLSSVDLRSAFLALNGTTYARPVGFNPVTGTNDAAVDETLQIQSTKGLVIISDSLPLIYPFPWPWSRVQVGDELQLTQSVTSIVVSVIIAVLGCWVGQIIVEQAVFIRRRDGWYKTWLILVAISIGVSGTWCTQFNMSAAITVTIPVTGTVLPVSWSLWVAMCAAIPAVVLSWLGLILLMQDVENIKAESKRQRTGVAHLARQARKEAEETKRKKAALSNLAHFIHLKDSTTWRVVVGGLLICGGMWLSRITLWSVWSVQATWQSSPSAWAVSVILSLVLVCPAILMYYHAMKWRTSAVFLLASALIIDWQVHINMGTFVYATSVLSTPSTLYTVLLTSTAVTLITGIICAIACFGFVGLQFSRMQLSRNGLSVLVASLESVINKLKTNIEYSENEVLKARTQADQMAKIIECINIIRPIPKEYAFALATQANTSTMATLLSTLDLSQGSSAHRSNASSILAIAKRAGSKQVWDEDDRPSQPHRASTTQEKMEDEERSTQPISALQETRDNIVSPTLESSVDKIPVLERDSSDNTTGTNQTSKSHVTKLEERRSSHPVARRSSSKQSGAAIYPIGNETKQFASAVETTESSTNSITHVENGTKQMDHTARCRQYEQDVLAVLAEHLNHHKSSQLPIAFPASTTQNSKLDADPSQIVEFSLVFPTLGTVSMNGRNSITRSVNTGVENATLLQWRVPPLGQLLQHPICIEIIKDELQRIHSVENLMFFLHAVRYRKLLCSGKARRIIANHLYQTFIAETSEQQININTRQRDRIAAIIKKRKDDAYAADLFQEAEREVEMLMETNVMKTFAGTPKHRLCVWLFHAVDMGKVMGWEQDLDERDPPKRSNVSSLLMSKVDQQGISETSNNQ